MGALGFDVINECFKFYWSQMAFENIVLIFMQQVHSVQTQFGGIMIRIIMASELTEQ